MKAKKLLRKSVNASIDEYKRIHAILFPSAEPIQLTAAQYAALDLAAIESAMYDLGIERDRLLLEQSRHEMTRCQINEYTG